MNKSLLTVAVVALTASASASAYYEYRYTTPVAGETVLATDMNGNHVTTVSGLMNMHDAFLVRKVKNYDRHNAWTRANSFRAINQDGLYVPIGRVSTVDRADKNCDGYVTHREARWNHPQVGLGWLMPNGQVYVSRVEPGMPVSLRDTRFVTVPTRY